MGAERLPKPPQPTQSPSHPEGPRRRRVPREERVRLAWAEGSRPGEGTSGSQGQAGLRLWLIWPRKEYVQLGPGGQSCTHWAWLAAGEVPVREVETLLVPQGLEDIDAPGTPASRKPVPI